MIFNKLQKNKNYSQGFTLIELMVASTLFTVVMMMGVGSLVVSSNSAKSSQKMRIAVDNVNFAVESMTRELRTGSFYLCTNDEAHLLTETESTDLTGCSVMAFTPQKLEGEKQIVDGKILRVAYKMSNRGDNTFSLQRCETSTSTSSPCYDIVSNDVNIERLNFHLLFNDSYNIKVQPRVEILIKGTVKTKDGHAPFALQTMVSQRATEQ